MFSVSFILGCYCSSNYSYINTSTDKDNNRIFIDKSPKTSAAPTFSIDSPLNYSLHGKLASNYSFTIATGIGNYTWYQFLDLGVNSTPSELKGITNEYFEEPFNQTMWNSLANGSSTFRIYINNSLGEIGYKDVIIRIDIINPTLIVNSPQNFTRLIAPPNIQVTATDANMHSVWYSVGETNITLESGVSEPLDSTIWNGLPDEGQFTINFFANDSVGNINNTYSLTLYKDVINPSLVVNSPANNTYWSSAPNIQATASDTYFDSVWYSVGVTNITLESGVSEPLDSTIWNGLPDEGQFTINFYANDSAGNLNNTYSIILYKDVLTPSLSINSPADNTFWDSIPNVQVTASDTYFDSVWYTVGGTKILLESGVSEPLDSTIWNGLLDEGQFTIDFFANDSAGNINNTFSITLYKDVVTPSLSIDLPVSNIYWNSVPNVQVTGSDPYLDSVWYTVGGTKILLESSVSEPLDSTIWNGLADEGQFTINFFANDSAGNINNTYSLTLYKDVINPSLVVNSPANNTYWSSAPNIQITGSDPYLDSVWYMVGGTKILLESGVSEPLDSNIWNGLPDEGQFTVNFFANDSAGNINNTYLLTLYKDILTPSLSINSPADNTFWDSIPNVQATASDTYLDSVWYMVGGTKILLESGVSEPLDSTIWNGLADEGQFTINFFTNDSAGNINNTYSLTFYKDMITPSLSIDLPANNTYWNSIPNIQVTASDTYFDSVWYTVGGTKILLESSVSEPLDSAIWNGLADEGQFTINFFANDSAGNINNTYSLTLYKDILTPSLSINSPANNTYWNSVPNVQATASDTYFDSVWYMVGGTKILLESGVSEPLDSAIWNGLPDEGQFMINFFANDSAGNINNTYSITFYKDVVTPSLNVNLPANNTYWNSTPNVQATATDTYFDSVWYTIGSTKILLESGVSEPLDSAIWNGLPDEGQFTIYFFANDSAGNINNTYTLTLYKDVITPSLSIDLPIDGTYWNSIPNVQITSVDTYFDSVWYTIGSTKILLVNGVSELLDSTIWNSLADEAQFTINFFANDSAGNTNSTYSFTLYKDIIAPRLTLQTPLNYTYHNSRPPINVLVHESNLGSLTYTVIGHAPLALFNNTDVYLSQSIWDSLFQGEFYIVITSFDTLGQSSELSILLYKDTIAPVVAINLPTNNTYWNLAPYLNVSAFDPNLDTIWYGVNSFNITLSNNTNQQLSSSIWNSLPDEGVFELNIYANDTFGYLNDIFTLTLYKDILNPTIIINSPVNNTYHKLPPIINVTVFDPYFHSIWYRVGTQDVPLTNNTNQQLLTGFWNSLPEEGNFVIYFYANDSAGNLNDLLSLTLNRDIKNPIITIINPNSNDLFGDISPNFELSLNDLNLNETWYMLYNSTWNSLNYSFNGLTGVINQAVWDEFWNGTVTIKFYANDTLNNLGFSEVTVRKNRFAPIITIETPENNELFGINAPSFTIYKSGLVLDSTWYSIDATNFTFSGLTVDIDQSAWDTYGFSDVTITFYINNSLGQMGIDTITLRKDPDPPVVSVTYTNPSNNSYCDNEPTFRVLVYEPNIDSIWYRVGTSNVFISNNTYTTLINAIWNILPQGEFSIEIFANDTLGYMNDPLNLTFLKDTLAPQLVINQPLNFTYFNSQPTINITFYDPNSGITDCTYTVSGYAPILLENNTVSLLDETIWNALDDGEFLVYITAWDSFAHINNSYTLTLYKDTMPPSFGMILPANNSYYNSPPTLKIIVHDPNLYKIWYINGIHSIEMLNNTEQILSSSIWNSLIEESFVLEFFANDTFGYTSSLVNLTLIKDLTSPLITLNSPTNNTYYSSPPNMNIVATDLDLDTVWYTVLGTKIIIHGGVEPMDQSIWDNLKEGEFQVYIYANDTAGNLNDSLMLTLYKDTTAPKVFINTPYNNTYWNIRPSFNVVVYDQNPVDITYRIPEFPSYIIPINNNTDTQLLLLIWSDLPEGLFIVEIIAEDSLGNINDTLTLLLYKDTVDPEITINVPQSTDFYGIDSPDFDISINENNLNTTWYSIIGNLTVIKFTELFGSIDQTLWNSVGNGTHTIRFYANDTAGNQVYEDVTVNKNIYTPIITIYSPGDNDLFSNDSPEFTIYKSGPSIQSTWYTIDNGVTNFTFTGSSWTIDQTAWDQYLFDSITLRVFVNDSLGSVGSDEVTIRKDPNMPIIVVNSPVNQTAIATAPFLNLTIIEPNLDHVWYTVNNIFIEMPTNYTIYLDSSIWNNLPQGEFIIKLFSNDTAENLNDLYQLHLSKDTIGPEIFILLPTIDQKIGRTAPFFELSLFDINNISASWYTIDGGVPVEFIGSIGRINQELWAEKWDSVDPGEVITIRFYSRDTLGNENYSDINVLKDEPIVLPKYLTNLIGWLIPTIGLIAMIPFLFVLNKSRYYQGLTPKDKEKLGRVLIATCFLFALIILFNIF